MIEALELLAPAGNWDCVRAAVENGADAVYFGLQCGFNARGRATNFHEADLPELINYLHMRGVKGYVTVNTLVFTKELEAMERLLRTLAAAHVDAILVQDLGVARLAREIAPSLALHASTQMTLTSAENIAAVHDLQFTRVVLPRELSIDEMSAIHVESSVSLEAFVHGALCVAYSGQCLTSESLGGRSANRGECAQACRLPYEVIRDGERVELDDVRYLLSPQDLAAYELIPSLVQAGVRSFKIEGRLKTPEYVANITRNYRDAIRAFESGRAVVLDRQRQQEMEMSFSRGFSPGWYAGIDHKQLVPGLSSAKRGVLLGEVQAIRRERVTIEVQSSIAPGDGIVFAGDRVTGKEQGGRVYQVWQDGIRQRSAVHLGEVEIALQHGLLDWDQIHVGQQVWKTDDPKLNERLRKTYETADPVRRVDLYLVVRAVVGERLFVQARTATGRSCEVVSDAPLSAATKHPLQADLLRAQFGRLGGTIYRLAEVKHVIEGGPMVPLSVLGQLRRRLVETLQRDDSVHTQPTSLLAEGPVLPRWRERIGMSCQPPNSFAVATAVTSPEASVVVSAVSSSLSSLTESSFRQAPAFLHLLCRSLSQLQEVIEFGPRLIYADFADIRQYREAVEVCRRHGNVQLFLATPRIHKPGEMGIFRAIEKCEPDGILVRNLAGLDYFAKQGISCVADFSLNIANELTADYLKGKKALRLTPSYDLNREQLLDLLHAAPASWFEVVVHQHMPMFHMEHCVFCAVLSPGTNKTNCGRPCDLHQVELTDRVGMTHPLTADVGCRNTLFNAVAQSSAEIVPQLLSLGVIDFRIELLRESGDEIRTIVDLYRRLLAGDVLGSTVWAELRAANRVGVTRGTLEHRRDPLAIL